MTCISVLIDISSWTFWSCNYWFNCLSHKYSTLLELRRIESYISHRFLFSFFIFNQAGFPFLLFLNTTYIHSVTQTTLNSLLPFLCEINKVCMNEFVWELATTYFVMMIMMICVFVVSTFAVVVVVSLTVSYFSTRKGRYKHYQLFIFLYIITAFVLIAISYLPLIKVLSNPNDQSPAFTTA